MLESFVSTQKMGVQKALQKKFKQFISYKRDFVELLMATLQVMTQITSSSCWTFNSNVYNTMHCSCSDGHSLMYQYLVRIAHVHPSGLQADNNFHFLSLSLLG